MSSDPRALQICEHWALRYTQITTTPPCHKYYNISTIKLSTGTSLLTNKCPVMLQTKQDTQHYWYRYQWVPKKHTHIDIQFSKSGIPRSFAFLVILWSPVLAFVHEYVHDCRGAVCHDDLNSGTSTLLTSIRCGVHLSPLGRAGRWLISGWWITLSAPAALICLTHTVCSFRSKKKIIIISHLHQFGPCLS